MIEQTFNQWSQAGYQIKKGSRHVGRNEKGECLFSEAQVRLVDRSPLYLGTSHWDNATDQNTCGGPMHGIYGNCN